MYFVDKSSILLQAFYWNTENYWFKLLSSKCKNGEFSDFTHLWLPPVSKGASGVSSMGYDPYDYYDLGEFEQKGTRPTRFGAREDLDELIKSCKLANLKLIADIIPNHNSGGASEWNPNVGRYTHTDFSEIKSGRFKRNYESFHPCSSRISDRGFFSDFADLAFSSNPVKDEIINWGLWMSEQGFSEWRFDFVKGLEPEVIKLWRERVPGEIIAEYWDGDVNELVDWLEEVNFSCLAFDFPLYYKFEKLSNNPSNFSMFDLLYSGLSGQVPQNSVTFVANHDIDNVSDKFKPFAYAYILTLDVIPSVFWKDFEKPSLNNFILSFLRIRKEFRHFAYSVPYCDERLMVMERSNQSEAFIVCLNLAPEQTRVHLNFPFNVSKVSQILSDGNHQILNQNSVEFEVSQLVSVFKVC